MSGVKGKGPTEAAHMRRQAEERLQGREAHRSPPLAQGQQAMQGLVHELEVHQIELEMQNEELRQACEELQVSKHMV